MTMLSGAIKSAELASAAGAPQLATRVTAELMRFIHHHPEKAGRSVVVLDPGMRLERRLDPTYINDCDALRKNHPQGASLVTNRWSGSFLDLVGFSGSYFGFAPVQDPKHAAALSVLKLGLFGVEAEMAYYIRQPGHGGAPSMLDAGVKKHGVKRLPNGEINPLLGLSGSYIVRYVIERPLNLLDVDFSSDAFISMLDIVGNQPKVKMLLPENVSLTRLFVGEETRGMHLLYRAAATAFRQKSDVLKIDGIVSTSIRAAHKEGTRQAKVICIWGKDGEVLQQLRPVSISYFNFDGNIPREIYTRIDPGTDFSALRRKATQ